MFANFSPRWIGLVAAGAVLLLASTAQAQPENPPAEGQGPFRRLARDVETTIPIGWNAAESVSVHDFVDLLHGIPNLEWTPNSVPKSRTLFEMSKAVSFRRSIWNLEFTFKPLRMLRVELPQPDGKLERRIIWYMVYRVKNTGGHMVPKKEADGTWSVSSADTINDPMPIRFIPGFRLECPKLAEPKAYHDVIIPLAVPLIQQREDANRKLLNSVEISQRTVAPSTSEVDNSVWGVVTWEGIDLAADEFSVFITGLTNAYRWQDDPTKIAPGTPPGTGQKFVRRTLKLNFWRPGDEVLEPGRDQRVPEEIEIIYGQIPGQPSYEWVWR